MTAAVTYPSLKTEADILAFAETLERGAATHVAILVHALSKSTEPYEDFVA